MLVKTLPILPAKKRVSLVFFTLFLSACNNSAPGSALDSPMADGPHPRVVPASEALATPALPTLDPSSLNDAEINKVMAGSSRCEFSYTSSGKPIMATSLSSNGVARGILKVHGLLVELAAPAITDFTSLERNGGVFTADRLQFEITPMEDGDGRRAATAHFRVGDQLDVGYKGYYQCNQNQS